MSDLLATLATQITRYITSQCPMVPPDAPPGCYAMATSLSLPHSPERLTAQPASGAPITYNPETLECLPVEGDITSKNTLVIATLQWP
jgi:hypothetical protein